jgi:hypothetical protein
MTLASLDIRSMLKFHQEADKTLGALKRERLPTIPTFFAAVVNVQRPDSERHRDGDSETSAQTVCGWSTAG